MSIGGKEKAVVTSVKRMHPEKKRYDSLLNFVTLFHNYACSCMTNYCLCCRAVIAERDRLCLQESHFCNAHQLHPYYVNLILLRLQTTYCTPVELEHDINFFSRCTVSLLNCAFNIFRTPGRFCCFCLGLQEVSVSLVPFIFEVYFTSELPIAMPDLHCLLENFLPQFYYNEWYKDLNELLNLSMTLRRCSVTSSPLKVFVESIRSVKGPNFSYDSSEVSSVFEHPTLSWLLILR